MILRRPIWFSRPIALAFMLVVGSAIPATAQQNDGLQVSGRVVDAATGDALPGAHVFLVGTTVGTTSGTSGQFSFQLPPGRPEYEIMASMIGFEAQVRTIGANDVAATSLDFELGEATYQLNEIEVASSNEEWKANLERFQELLFSTTEFSTGCVIQNAEYLDLSLNPNTGILSASSAQPFVFVNESLGYKVTVHNFRFTGSGTMYRWEGALRFENLTTESESQAAGWRRNRQTAYSGSFRHFLTALAAGETTSEGFRLTTVPEPGVNVEFNVTPDPADAVELTIADPTIPTWVIDFERVLAVAYVKEPESRRFRAYMDINDLRERSEFEQRSGRLIPRENQLSWLQLHRDGVLIDRAGTEYGKFGLDRSGYWAWERMCEQLPADYTSSEGGGG